MPQLFMVYLGGHAGQCHIEVHDVRFVIGEQIEDTYPELIQQWYGDKSGLHLDSYHIVDTVLGSDGKTYQVNVSQQPAADTAMKLYFVNMGGYHPDQMAEQHAFSLFACRDEIQAKQMARQRLLTHSQHPHKDNLHAVDNCLAIRLLDSWHIHLTVSPKPVKAIKPDWFGYEVIG